MGGDGPSDGRPSEEPDVTSPTDRPSPARPRSRVTWVLGLLVLGLALSLGSVPSRIATLAGDALTGQGASGDDPTLRSRRGRVEVGISPGFVVADLPPEQLRADLEAVHRLGARWVRVDLSWERIAPTPSSRDWSDADRLLDAADAAGLRVLAVVGYRPAWGTRDDGSADPAGFAGFVGEAARRYRSQVDAWELWNEPNLQRFWTASPDPAAYARLVDAAAREVREHDPASSVVLGGLSPAVDAEDGSQMSPITFLRGVYDAGLDRSLFDAVSVHPYSYPALPSGDQDWNTFNRLPDIHDVMVQAGDGAKPLWLTEYGAPTGASDRAVSSRRQARMMVGAYRQAVRLPYVGALFLYSLRDTSTDTTDPEAGFGLLGHSGRAKPAYTALRRELQRS